MFLYEFEKNLISQRTKEAEIKTLLDKKVSKSAIARILKTIEVTQQNHKNPYLLPNQTDRRISVREHRCAKTTSRKGRKE